VTFGLRLHTSLHTFITIVTSVVRSAWHILKVNNLEAHVDQRYFSALLHCTSPRLINPQSRLSLLSNCRSGRRHHHLVSLLLLYVLCIWSLVDRPRRRASISIILIIIHKYKPSGDFYSLDKFENRGKQEDQKYA
jgi:hypothetical protein